MTAIQLALLLALAAPSTPARNRPPPASPADAPGTSSTLSDEDVAQRVHAYLGTIDTPIPAARWKALGPRAVPALESVLHDPGALPSRRAKSVEALSIIGGPRAKSLILETIRAEREPFGVRAAALRGAPRVLPSNELVSALRPVLETATASPVRAIAADTLARHGGSSGCRAVRAQADREHGLDREQFSGALDRCGALAP